jgi:threonine/homoserine/homoserine lactone efflux protein
MSKQHVDMQHVDRSLERKSRRQMMEMLFFSAFGLSLALWAVPGAVTTEALRRGLTRRWRSVSFILLGTLAGDALWASVSFIFAHLLARNTVVHGLLGALETIVLLSLAWASLKEGLSKKRAAARETSIHGDVVTGALLSLLSPYTIAFWLGVTGMTLPASVSSMQALGMGVFFTGFLLAAVVWGLFLSGVVLVGRRFVGPGLFRWMSLGCGLALGYFGLSVLTSLLAQVLA